MTVLVVIDMQNGFIHPSSAYVVPVVTDLVRRWDAAGGDIVFTRFHNAPGSLYERLMGWTEVAVPPDTDLVDELLPYEAKHQVVDKPGYTLFTESGSQVIKDGGWSDLVFCGLTTESCVLKGAVDAFERNLTPWMVTDASATHGGKAAHEAGLLVARRFIGAGQLITTADLELSPGAITYTTEPVEIRHNITARAQ